MAYGTQDGDVYWHGYGIESITTFLNDVKDLEGQKITVRFTSGKTKF